MADIFSWRPSWDGGHIVLAAILSWQPSWNGSHVVLTAILLQLPFCPGSHIVSAAILHQPPVAILPRVVPEGAESSLRVPFLGSVQALGPVQDPLLVPVQRHRHVQHVPGGDRGVTRGGDRGVPVPRPSPPAPPIPRTRCAAAAAAPAR